MIIKTIHLILSNAKNSNKLLNTSQARSGRDGVRRDGRRRVRRHRHRRQGPRQQGLVLPQRQHLDERRRRDSAPALEEVQETKLRNCVNVTE